MNLRWRRRHPSARNQFGRLTVSYLLPLALENRALTFLFFIFCSYHFHFNKRRRPEWFWALCWFHFLEHSRFGAACLCTTSTPLLYRAERYCKWKTNVLLLISRIIFWGFFWGGGFNHHKLFIRFVVLCSAETHFPFFPTGWNCRRTFGLSSMFDGNSAGRCRSLRLVH